MLRPLLSLLRALGALVLLAALLLGLPGVLALGTVAVGRQAPPGPTGSLWQMLTSPDNGNLFLWALVVVGWLAWAAFALSVVVEIPAQLRGRVPRRLPALGWSQRLAGGLVGAVLAIMPTAVGALAATPAAAPATVAAVAPRAVSATPEAVPAAAHSAVPAGDAHPVYTVRDTRPADSLWSIAERELGSGNRWHEIARLNAGRVMDAEGRTFDADRPIQPGWRLLLPRDARSATGAAPAPSTAPALPAGKHTTVTVRPGDTLSAIAERDMGAADRWPELYAANEGVPGPDGTHLTDPDVIQPGMVLTIPGRAAPRGGSGGGRGSGSPGSSGPGAGQGQGQGDGHAQGSGSGSGSGAGSSSGTGSGSAPSAGAGVGVGGGSTAGQSAGSGSVSSAAPTPTAPTPTAPISSASAPNRTPSTTPTAKPTPSSGGFAPGAGAGAGTAPSTAAAALPQSGERTGFTASSAEQLAGLGSAVLLAVLGGALARRRARRRSAGRPLTRRHALPARPQSGPPPLPNRQDHRPPDFQQPAFEQPAFEQPEYQHPRFTPPAPEPSAENGLDLLDRALRSMARNVARDGHRLPPLTLARITATGTVELYLATPAPPIPPFRAAHASTVWWCTEDEFGLLSADAVRDIVAPYPALVSVGTGEDGATVLLDLEAVRLLHVSGSPQEVRAVLRTLALELTLTPLADRVGVHVVGVAEDLAVLAEDRLTVHADLEQALLVLRERDRDVRAELLAVGAATPRDARARGVAGAVWAPDVVLCAEYPTGDLPAALGRLLDARPRGSVAVVTAAPPPGAGPVARWTLPARGLGVLPGLDLTVRLQALDDGGYAAWLGALATEAQAEAEAAADAEAEADVRPVTALQPVAPPRSRPGDNGEGAGRPEPAAPSSLGSPGAPQPPASGMSAAPQPAPGGGGLPIPAPAPVPGPRGHGGRFLPMPGEGEPADAAGETGPTGPRREPAGLLMGAGRHAAHADDGSAAASGESWILQLLAVPRAVESTGRPRVAVLGPVEIAETTVPEADIGAYVQAAVQDDAVASDWQEFRELHTRGIAERGAAGDTALARALALVRGAPFAEADGPGYAWAEPFRAAIAQQIVDAAHELTLRRLRMGDHRGAEAAATRGLVVAPEAQLLLRDLLCVHADERAVAALQRTAARLERIPTQAGARLEAESSALLAELRGGEPAWS